MVTYAMIQLPAQISFRNGDNNRKDDPAEWVRRRYKHLMEIGKATKAVTGNFHRVSRSTLGYNARVSCFRIDTW